MSQATQTDATPTIAYSGPYTMQPAHHGTCPDCGRVAFLPHECPPWYTVQLENERVKIRAISPEEAAEQFAKTWDSYAMLATHNGTMMITVSVTDEAGRVTWWDVRGEMVPEYIAQEVEG